MKTFIEQSINKKHSKQRWKRKKSAEKSTKYPRQCMISERFINWGQIITEGAWKDQRKIIIEIWWYKSRGAKEIKIVK